MPFFAAGRRLSHKKRIKMKQRILVCCVGVLWACSSCLQKGKEVPDGIDWSQYPVVELSNPTKITVTGEPFLEEQDIYLASDSDFFFQPFFSQLGEVHLYRLENDTLKWRDKITQKGNGPLETEQNAEVCRTSDGHLSLFAGGYAARSFVLPAGSPSSSLADLGRWTRHSFPTNLGLLYEMLPIDTARYLVCTAGEVPSLLATYQLGDSALHFIPFPYPEDGLSDMSRTMSYDGRLYKHPSEEKFLYACYSGRWVFTFELEGNSMKNMLPLYGLVPQFKLKKDGVGVSKSENDFMGANAFVTAKHIFVHLHEFMWKDFFENKIENQGYPYWFANQIYVFDWDGNPVKRIKLDSYVHGYVLDSSERYLYALTKDVKTDDVSFLRYSLK